MKIICSGMFANTTVGHIDNLMAYALGFQQLGHDVYLFEDVDAKRCTNDAGQPSVFAEWSGSRHFEGLASAYGVWPRSSLIYNGGEATHGMPFAEVKAVAESADLVLLIGGRLKTSAILDGAKQRAYVDINPAKTQVYYSQYDVDYGFDRFDHFFTYGLNIGSTRCDLPSGGLQWHGLLPPVFLGLWPPQIHSECQRFTTVSSWAGRSTFYWKDKYSGEKSDQWHHFIDLPLKTKQEMEIALKLADGYADDRQKFLERGWKLTDATQLRKLDDYRTYIADSRAEFSVANNRYVEFQTAWVSDRTARYLASGKPVLIQSTGVEAHLPVGTGLVTFGTMSEAIQGIESINQHYETHCRQSREIAVEHFDAERICQQILKVVGLG